MRTERRGKTSAQSAVLAAILIAGCQGNSVSEQYSRMAAVASNEFQHDHALHYSNQEEIWIDDRFLKQQVLYFLHVV
jgi:hypothetical protein